MIQTDRQLVRRCLDGESRAFGILYDRHTGRVFGLLRRLTGNEAEAQDLTQETFLAAHGALSAWRGEGKLATWLCGIAFRRYANACRRRAGREVEPLDEALEIAAPDADPLVRVTRQEARQQIERALAALPEICREVFVLVKVEGLSYREAADWLEIPVGTVQSRLWRAVRLLQAALADQGAKPAGRFEGAPADSESLQSDRTDGKITPHTVAPKGGEQDALRERA
jgi:RNA polymerase sigma-70 factor (ECF subfamily)